MSLANAVLGVRLDVSYEGDGPDDQISLQDESEIPLLRTRDWVRFLHGVAIKLGIDRVPVGKHAFDVSSEGIEVVELPTQWGDQGRGLILDGMEDWATSTHRQMLQAIVSWPSVSEITAAAKLVFKGTLDVVVEVSGDCPSVEPDFLRVTAMDRQHASQMLLGGQRLAGEIFASAMVIRDGNEVSVAVAYAEPSGIGNWFNQSLVEVLQGVIASSRTEWAAELVEALRAEAARIGKQISAVNEAFCSAEHTG